MKISARFKKLALWNKIGVIGSIASILALVIYFIPSEKPSSTIIQKVDENSTAVINTGTGSVHIGNYFGVSEERFQALSEQLGVTKIALKNFFDALKRENVPYEKYDATLREVAKEYKELESRLGQFKSEGPKAINLKRKAKEALDEGTYARADELLTEAEKIELEAAKQIAASAEQRFLNAAKTRADRGALQLAQLKYIKAAEHFRKASELTPISHSQQRGLYIVDCADAYQAYGDKKKATMLL